LRRLREQGGKAAALVDGLLCRRLSAYGLLPDLRPSLTHYVYCSDFIRRASQGQAEARAEHYVAPWGLAGMPERLARPGPDFDSTAPLELVYAGQFVEHKGLLLLLEALAQCRRPHRLTVIGDGAEEYEDRCRRFVVDHSLSERVRFLGRRRPEDVPAILGRAQVLVTPSLWDEPFSLVVLEGLSAGLAVIASATGGTPEAIRDGVNGLLFPRGDAAALTEAIDLLEEDRPLCRRLAAQGRRTAQERFSLERMVDHLLAALGPASILAPWRAA
jgi:glycosyltransferase involved in cell wall biosynthesis